MIAAERVFVCAPFGRDAALACELLGAEGITGTVCGSIEELCASLSDTAGAAVIGEEALTPPAVQLLADTLDSQPPWSDIPLIVLAGREFSTSGVRPVIVLGHLRNVMVLERPVRRLVFVRTVAVALRSRRRQFELRAYLEERAELLRYEQRVNRMKDEFLMTLSHELRTPLTAIYGWARMLATGTIRDSQRQRALDAIERNAAAQTQLVSDLLDVSRAISGKIRLNIEPIDPRQVIEAAVDTMQPAADAKHIQMKTELDGGTGLVNGDRDRLQQVVWNLISNAIKFTPENGRIEVRLDRVGSHADITVRDTGAGIDRAFLPHAFDRFRQGDAGTTRQTGGLGLGLAIVRHIVELHGGTVAAESDGPGHGATFRIRLPLACARTAGNAAADQRPSHPPERAPQPARSLDGVRVLVVGTGRDARELFTGYVESAGGDVRVARSVDDAMTLVSVWSPQAVVSDLEMAPDDSWALPLQLNAIRERTIPAVAVTRDSRPEDRLRLLEAGYAWHLSKPVNDRELVAVIASLAQRTRPNPVR